MKELEFGPVILNKAGYSLSELATVFTKQELLSAYFPKEEVEKAFKKPEW